MDTAMADPLTPVNDTRFAEKDLLRTRKGKREIGARLVRCFRPVVAYTHR